MYNAVRVLYNSSSIVLNSSVIPYNFISKSGTDSGVMTIVVGSIVVISSGSKGVGISVPFVGVNDGANVPFVEVLFPPSSVGRGGSRIASIACMIPLLASISAMMTVELFILMLPSSDKVTLIEAPFRVTKLPPLDNVELARYPSTT